MKYDINELIGFASDYLYAEEASNELMHSDFAKFDVAMNRSTTYWFGLTRACRMVGADYKAVLKIARVINRYVLRESQRGGDPKREITSEEVARRLVATRESGYYKSTGRPYGWNK